PAVVELLLPGFRFSIRGSANLPQRESLAASQPERHKSKKPGMHEGGTESDIVETRHNQIQTISKSKSSLHQKATGLSGSPANLRE
ncbi:hypothetical protein HispidOSU_011961, partial [Sigmodon hispidus]